MQNRIKAIRAHYGLSQAEFAQKIKKAPGFIANVETGRSKISEATIETICEIFSVSSEWLKNGRGKMLINEMPAVNKTMVGQRIREIRKREKLTQAEFGKRAGYSGTQIRFVENGKIVPSNEFVHRVALAFCLNEKWLLSGNGNIDAEKISVDDKLVQWLNEHPEVILELRKRSGLD